MMIVLYDKDSTSFNSLGIGVLTDFRDTPTITEVLKGEYILEFDYLKNGKYSEFLDERNLIKALGQVFRIENIQPSNDGYRILARHIVFDLRDNYLVNVAPTNKTAQEALKWVLERACFETNFTVSGDCTKIASAKYIRMNLDEALFSADNSILNRFGGEPEYDNFHIILRNRRGKDTGIEIRERKNLTGFEMNKDLSTVKTRIMPVGPDGLLLPEVFIDSPLINNYQTPKIGKLEVSSSSDEEVSNEELFQLMRDTVAQEFENGIDKPTISIKVDFIELSKTEEYKKYQNLENVSLGDTLKFIVPSLNQQFSIRVIKTVKNANNGTIISLELGNEIPTFITSQKQNNQTIKEEIVISTLEQAKLNATNLLKHPFNGHWFFDETTGCAYICDTTELSTAKYVWQIGLGGIGISKNGIDGPFESAWTLDGGFVANFITTGKLDTNLIEGYEQLVQKVSKTEESVESIVTTTQNSIGGNHLYINEALETSVLEYTIQGKTEQVNAPTIENSSEIKTIPSIKNKLNIDSDNFSTLGFNFEFDKSKIKINGSSQKNGNTTIPTKTKLSKGTWTISFYKLGGSYEKNNYDFQLFVQGSEGTDKRFTNITGTRLENGESKKTTITLEEETEIFLYFFCSGAELVLNNYEIGIQIEKGFIAHEYRPFGNYAKIRVIGRNQFNLKTVSKQKYSYGLPAGTSNNIEIDSYDSNNLSFSIVSNDYAYILSNIHYLKPNKEYILSYTRENTGYIANKNTRYYIYSINENGEYVEDQHSEDPAGDKKYLFTTNETGMVAFAWGGDNKSSGASSVISNIMILEKTDETENIIYESYKEKEVLIDLNKSNLFNKNTYGFIENANFDSTGLIKDDPVFDLIYFELKKGTYKISNFVESDYLVVTSSNDIPSVGIQGNGRLVKYSHCCVYTMSNDGYLIIRINRETGVSVDELIEKLKIVDGYDDFYELCSGDILRIENGQVHLQKEIGKTILDGTTNITIYQTSDSNSHGFNISANSVLPNPDSALNTGTIYCDKLPEKSRNHLFLLNQGIAYYKNLSYFIVYIDQCKNMTVAEFKTWLSQNPLTVYYKLTESQEIRLKDTDISLFEGFNHIELVDNLEVNTSIKFLRKTPLSDDYVVQTQINQTNKNLANTTDKTNQNSSDINATNTNLNNNYYNKNQINEMQTTTNQNIVQVRNTVEALTTSTEYRINAINETITNGVPLVKTTSTSFGEEGWSMEKTGEEMSSNWNWKGLEVTKDKGKSTEEKKLVVNSDGAIMSNSETKNRAIQRPIMYEKGTSISDGKSVGLCHYYIGE